MTKTNITKNEKKKSRAFDLDNGSTFNNFLKIWIPTLIAQLISGTFIVFDTIFIAHGYHTGHIGEIWSWSNSGAGAAYAAIGPSGTAYAMPYSLLMVSLGLLIGGGVSTIVIKKKAQDDKKGAKKSLNSLTPIVLIYGVVITLILFIGAKVFIFIGSGFQSSFIDNWFNNPLFNSNWDGAIVDGEINNDAMGQLFQQASWYLRIQALGTIPYIYMISSQVTLRVEGKSNIGMRYTGASLFLNILFDFLFIVVFGLNLVGAALATVLAQTIAASLYYRYYRTKFPIRIDEFELSNGKEHIKKVSKLGISTMFLQLSSALILLSFTISIGLVYYGDSTATLNFSSAFQGYFSLFILFVLPVNGLAQATQVLVSYNYHRNRYKKANDAKNIGIRIVILYSIIVTLLVMFLPNITILFGRPSIGDFYPQRMAQIMFSTFIITNLLMITAIYTQSLDEQKRSINLLLAKSLLILPVALIIGLTTKDVLPAGTNWPWASGVMNSDYSIILFYSIPIIDIILLPVIIRELRYANNKIKINKK